MRVTVQSGFGQYGTPLDLLMAAPPGGMAKFSQDWCGLHITDAQLNDAERINHNHFWQLKSGIYICLDYKINGKQARANATGERIAAIAVNDLCPQLK